MAISYLATGTPSQNNGGTDPTPGIPAGCTAGTLLVCVVYSRGNVDESVSMPAGWDQRLQDRNTGGMLAVFTRPWQSGDAAPTITRTNFDGGPTGDTIVAIIHGFDGADTANPIVQIGTVSEVGSSKSLGPISGITLSGGAGSAVLVIGGRRDDAFGGATLSGDGLTWAQIHDQAITGGEDAHIVTDYAIDDAGGTTVTSKTYTFSTSVASEGKGVMLELRPYVEPTGQPFRVLTVL